MALAQRIAATGLLRPLALYVCLVALLGFWGVNVEDGGEVLAQSYRLLLGEIPHRDFISPRPVGSAFLHLIDFALPIPLLLASKLVTLAEFVVTGVCATLAVFGRRLSELDFPLTATLVVVTVVGMEQFLIAPFYTIDGVMLCTAGFLLLRRALEQDSLPRLAWALGLFGVAVTTKQSFWPVPPYALAVVAGVLAVRRVRLVSALGVLGLATGAAALAPLAYVAYVAVGGGFSEMRAQLLGAQPVYGQELIQLPESYAVTHLGVALVGLTAALAWLSIRRGEPRRAALDLGARVLASVLVLWLVVGQRFVIVGDWSQALFWCVVDATLVRSLAARRLELTGLSTAVLAFCVSLSWGAPTPGLAAGACLAYLTEAIWRGSAWPLAAARPRWIPRAAIAVAALLVTAVFLDVRARVDDGVARSTETIRLGGSLAYVAMNSETAAYFDGVRACVARYPARWTAVVPEGALVYPTLRLRNPFPIDWFWADDYHSANGRARLLAAASQIDRRGDYLVLFQTFILGLTTSTPGVIAPSFSDPTLPRELASKLRDARRTNCGEFVAYYDPVDRPVDSHG